MLREQEPRPSPPDGAGLGNGRRSSYDKKDELGEGSLAVDEARDKGGESSGFCAHRGASEAMTVPEMAHKLQARLSIADVETTRSSQAEQHSSALAKTMLNTSISPLKATPPGQAEDRLASASPDSESETAEETTDAFGRGEEDAPVTATPLDTEKTPHMQQALTQVSPSPRLRSAGSVTQSAENDDELARFRRAWKDEVQRKQQESAITMGSELSQSQAGSRQAQAGSSQDVGFHLEAQDSKKQETVSNLEAKSADDVMETTLPNPLPPRRVPRRVPNEESISNDYTTSTFAAKMRPVSADDLARRKPMPSSSAAELNASRFIPSSTAATTPPLGSASASTMDVDTLSSSSLGASAPGAPIRLMRRAVQAYAVAVGLERSGELDEALVHYRKAFKLDSDADTLFDRACKAIQNDLDVKVGAQSTKSLRRELLTESEDVRESVCAALGVEDRRYRSIKQRQVHDSSYQASGTSGKTTAGDTEQVKHRDSLQQQQEQGLTTQTSASEGQSPRQQYKRRGGDQLSRLIQRLSLESGGKRDFSQVGLTPERDEEPVPIARVPDEIILLILTHIAAPRGRRGAEAGKPGLPRVGDPSSRTFDDPMRPRNESPMSEKHSAPGIGVVLAGPDYMSIEQLGRTCWKFRLLTQAWSVWKLIVNETYFPPQVPSQVSVPTLVKSHDNDWRTTFVEQPRIRLNGAYIAAYHYTRPGVHEENVWVRVVHVVEFYRSLRFLPDGRTLSLLTTDPPSETVRRMEPSLRLKGFAIGQWTLYPEGLDDDEELGRLPGPKVLVDNLHDKTLAGYTFRLILKLDKTGRGKWNRMEMLEYESINLRTGEVCPLPMNHNKPFHFSTVRSYGI